MAANDNADNILRVEFGNTFIYLKQKREERNVVIDMMEENPYIIKYLFCG